MAAVSSTSALAAAGTTIIIIPAMACGCSTITATAIRCVIATPTIGAGAAPGGNIMSGERTGSRVVPADGIHAKIGRWPCQVIVCQYVDYTVGGRSIIQKISL